MDTVMTRRSSKKLSCTENPCFAEKGRVGACEYLSEQPFQRLVPSRSVSGAPVIALGFRKLFAEPFESALCEETEYRGGTAIIFALCRKTEGVFCLPAAKEETKGRGK